MNKARENETKGIYFIAIIPPEPLASEVRDIKECIREKYNSSAALRSPAHITLFPPFRREQELEKELILQTSDFAQHYQPFTIYLNGFDCFSPWVIFIRNEKSPALDELQEQLTEFMESTFGLKDPQHGRPFHPHMTVAFKDLRKSEFRKAWAEFKNRSFERDFTVKSIFLLKHNGREWEVISRSDFQL